MTMRKDEKSYRSLAYQMLTDNLKELAEGGLMGLKGESEELYQMRHQIAAATLNLLHARQWLESLPDNLCPEVTNDFDWLESLLKETDDNKLPKEVLERAEATVTKAISDIVIGNAKQG